MLSLGGGKRSVAYLRLISCWYRQVPSRVAQIPGNLGKLREYSRCLIINKIRLLTRKIFNQVRQKTRYIRQDIQGWAKLHRFKKKIFIRNNNKYDQNNIKNKWNYSKWPPLAPITAFRRLGQSSMARLNISWSKLSNASVIARFRDSTELCASAFTRDSRMLQME